MVIIKKKKGFQYGKKNIKLSCEYYFSNILKN